MGADSLGGKEGRLKAKRCRFPAVPRRAIELGDVGDAMWVIKVPPVGGIALHV